MSTTLGAVGDILSVCLLIKELAIALDNNRGSAAEYQSIIRELHVLDLALLQVESLSRSQYTSPELRALYDTAKQTISNCRISIDAFAATIKKYSSSLAVGGSGNGMKDVARKVQWRATHKQDSMARFRAQITGYTESINMLLATAKITILDLNNREVARHLTDNERTTQEAFDHQNGTLALIRTRLDEAKEMITEGNNAGRSVLDRLNYIYRLGCDLKKKMCQVILGNVAIYRQNLALQSAFMARVDRPLEEAPFMLEDAIGRLAPVHLRFVTTWEAFDAVLEIRFEGKPGWNKVCRRQYVLQESATGKEISRTSSFGDTFLPGQRVAMSIIFKTQAGDQRSITCPRCFEVAKEPGNTDILCRSCNMWFRRITQADEDTSAILDSLSSESSLQGANRLASTGRKRKIRDEDEDKDNDSENDYSRFKRIRLIEIIKRLGDQSPQHEQDMRPNSSASLQDGTTCKPIDSGAILRFAKRVKSRFSEQQPCVILQFREILQAYQKVEKPRRSVYAEIIDLFKAEPDLVHDFQLLYHTSVTAAISSNLTQLEERGGRTAR